MTLMDRWRGSAGTGWEEVPLRSVARIGTGHTPDRTKPEYWMDCAIPWVTAADISHRTDGEFTPLQSTKQQISALGLANSAAVVHDPGTVMFCRTASVGLLTSIAKPMATTQAFVTWTAGWRVDSRFLLYLIATLRPELLRLAHGSTHLTIYMPDLEALRVILPPLELQRRVADFLDEQVALLDRAVGAASRRRELVLDRFRSELVDTVLRPPTEGRRTRLVDLFEYERNGIWGEEPDGGPDDIPCVRVADFDRFSFRAVEAPTIRKVPFAQRSPRLLRRGDVLLEKSGGTGRNPVGCAVLYESDTPAVCSNFVAALRPTATANAAYAGFLMAACYQSRRNGPFVNQTTGIQNLDSAAYLRLAVGVPEFDEQVARVDRILSARATTQAALALLSRQGELLLQRKQALITAAVTGEFDVTTSSARSVA